MTDKQYRIVTKSKHFIYFVTEEEKNENWCLKIAVKDRFSSKFKKAVVDETSGYKTILKIILSLPYGKHYMRFTAYNDSPYKFMELERPYRNEIKKAIKDTNTTYINESIPFYDYAIVQWEDLNDKERFFLYETPNERIAWTTTPLEQEKTGLVMSIELAIQGFGKSPEQPYIIIQNNYEKFGIDRTQSWVKVGLDGKVIGDKKLIFKEHELQELKNWIDINKLPILMYWTQEEIGSIEITKMIRKITSIEPNNYLKKTEWKSQKIIHAKELEEYINSLRDKIIGKTIDKIFYTGILHNSMWDDFYEYNNGEWYQEGKKVDEPQYYPWKESGTVLWLDSPVILDFEGTRFEIEYWTGSLVNVNTNSIDTEKYGADVSKHFSRHIIGQKLADIQIHKTKEVYFMNFEHLGIDRKNGDDMFEEIWFIFENGYKLELTTDHTDYTIFSEVK